MNDGRPSGDRRVAIPTVPKSLGGLVIGALVGAAVAGGSFLRRRGDGTDR